MMKTVFVKVSSRHKIALGLATKVACRTERWKLDKSLIQNNLQPEVYKTEEILFYTDHDIISSLK